MIAILIVDMVFIKGILCPFLFYLAEEVLTRGLSKLVFSYKILLMIGLKRKEFSYSCSLCL